MARLFGAYHALIKRRVLDHARQRNDAATPGKKPLAGVHAKGIALARAPAFQVPIHKAAQATATSARKQVAAAIGVEPEALSELTELTGWMATSLTDKMESIMGDSVERADDILADWDDLDPELSPRANDLGALVGMLGAGLAGIEGSALASMALSFGEAFAQMTRASQEDAGVEQYMWVTMRDNKVRPAHEALDEEVASWDDPPLSAEDSDIGEPCHPGDDYGCRCLSSPILSTSELDEADWN